MDSRASSRWTNNLLEGSVPSELAELESLTIGLPEFMQIQGMVSLQDRLLSNKPLGGALMRSGWEKMASLAMLDLSNAALVGSILESMVGMTRLRFMALDHNRLPDAVPAKLAAMPSIGGCTFRG